MISDHVIFGMHSSIRLTFSAIISNLHTNAGEKVWKHTHSLTHTQTSSIIYVFIFKLHSQLESENLIKSNEFTIETNSHITDERKRV